jgi:hypothetical protein
VLNELLGHLKEKKLLKDYLVYDYYKQRYIQTNLSNKEVGSYIIKEAKNKKNI